MTSQVTWLAKVAKLCNLRCGYCYEWNELGDADRMSMALWRRLFEAMRDTGAASATLVLHGGEPLIVPLPYLEEVLALRAEILGDTGPVLVQTNLYRLSEPILDFLERHRIHVGVSLDVVPGVRVALGGQATEAAVERNLDRVLARGLAVDGIAVLAGHTAPRITEVHDFFAARRLPLRVLPLFNGPDERPHDRFAIEPAAIGDALWRLFTHWLERGALIPLRPFDAWLAVVARRMLGAGGDAIDPDRDDDQDLIVNTNGDVYRVHEAYVPEYALGNLLIDDVATLLTAPAYQRARQRDRARLAQTCTGCRYAGACSGAPALSAGHRERSGTRCGLVADQLARIEAYLRSEGHDEGSLANLAA